MRVFVFLLIYCRNTLRSCGWQYHGLVEVEYDPCLRCPKTWCGDHSRGRDRVPLGNHLCFRSFTERGVEAECFGDVSDTRAEAVGSAYGKLPMSFEANRGQTDPAV